MPATSVVVLSVFVIDRSAVAPSELVSVAELLAELGSVTPAGTAIAAVLDRLPVADSLILPVRVNVTVPPDNRFAVVLMLPEPDADEHDDPDEATQVQVAPVIADGSVSVTVAPVTGDGPVFVATIVYVTDVPATSVVAPSVFVIDRSAVGTKVSVSVAALLPGVGSVTPPGAATVAVFDRDPVAVDITDAVNVYVAVPLGSRVMVSLMLPVPENPQLEPAEAVQVQVAPVSVDGNVSVTVAPVAVDGPVLVATMV